MKDQVQRDINLVNKPKRIVSLVPSQTELLVSLGLRNTIVGLTKFCVHPSDLRDEKTIVGGTKQVHLDKIKSLDPEIILCNKEENTAGMVEELQRICTVHVSDITSIDDCLELIGMYGELFDCQSSATELIKDISDKRRAFDSFIAHLPQLKVVYFIWKDPYMVVGGDTFINEMLSLNNLKNVFEEKPRYPQIDLLDLKKFDLDLIMLSSEPYPFKEAHIQLLKSQFPKIEIRIVDGEMFSWYGSRLLPAFDYFKWLRQDLNVTAL